MEIKKFNVKFTCKFKLNREYKSISLVERCQLIKDCIDKAIAKNDFKDIGNCNNVLFDEMPCEMQGKNGILMIGEGLSFNGILGSADTNLVYFKHSIRDVAMVCQSNLNSSYFGYVARNQNCNGREFYIYFSNTQSESVYTTMSNWFKEFQKSETESAMNRNSNYVSMRSRNYMNYNMNNKQVVGELTANNSRTASIRSDNNRNVRQNSGGSCSQSTINYRKMSTRSNISDFNVYDKNNNFIIHNKINSINNSLENDDEDRITRDTFTIEVSNYIDMKEMVRYLKDKYEVITMNRGETIFVNRKLDNGHYESID